MLIDVAECSVPVATRTIQPEHPGRSATALDTSKPGTRRSEVVAFLLLAVVAWPVLTVGVVGGYGFMVWMTQQIYGPPGAAHAR
jgi:nitrate reductase NapE